MSDGAGEARPLDQLLKRFHQVEDQVWAIEGIRSVTLVDEHWGPGAPYPERWVGCRVTVAEGADSGAVLERLRALLGQAELATAGGLAPLGAAICIPESPEQERERVLMYEEWMRQSRAVARSVGYPRLHGVAPHVARVLSELPADTPQAVFRTRDGRFHLGVVVPARHRWSSPVGVAVSIRASGRGAARRGRVELLREPLSPSEVWTLPRPDAAVASAITGLPAALRRQPERGEDLPRQAAGLIWSWVRARDDMRGAPDRWLVDHGVQARLPRPRRSVDRGLD